MEKAARIAITEQQQTESDSRRHDDRRIAAARIPAPRRHGPAHHTERGRSRRPIITTPTVGRRRRLSDTPFGELSLREVGGRAVLSGFNANHAPDGAVEDRVAEDPSKLFNAGVRPTTVAQAGNPGAPNFVPNNYGGYIVPGSSLDDLRILVSQWYVPMGLDNQPTGPGTYNVQESAVNVN